MVALDGIVGSYFANAFPNSGIRSSEVEPVSVIIKQAYFGFYRYAEPISGPEPFGLHLHVRPSQESSASIDSYVRCTSLADMKGLMEQLGCTRAEDLVGKTITAYVSSNPADSLIIVALGVQNK